MFISTDTESHHPNVWWVQPVAAVCVFNVCVFGFHAVITLRKSSVMFVVNCVNLVRALWEKQIIWQNFICCSEFIICFYPNHVFVVICIRGLKPYHETHTSLSVEGHGIEAFYLVSQRYLVGLRYLYLHYFTSLQTEDSSCKWNGWQSRCRYALYDFWDKQQKLQSFKWAPRLEKRKMGKIRIVSAFYVYMQHTEIYTASSPHTEYHIPQPW